jgi:pyridoxamine-phosphate oxidase
LPKRVREREIASFLFDGLAGAIRIDPRLFRSLRYPRQPPFIFGTHRAFPATTANPRRYPSMEISYLNQKDAQQLDVDLMSPSLGFSIYQLMELAGLSCASAIQAEYPSAGYPHVLILAGPGNNGGDGLVCARHLHHFGYTVQVSYPVFKAENELYRGLVTQLESLGINFIDVEEASRIVTHRQCNVVVDAMFGFSFSGLPRNPFLALVEAVSSSLRDNQGHSAHVNEKINSISQIGGNSSSSNFAVAAVDVPSGFHVEDGDIHGLYPVHPHMLISLTAPKLCAQKFHGEFHYLGGRFIPQAIVKKYNLVLPEFEGAAQCVNLNKVGSSGLERKLESIRKNYHGEVATTVFEEQNPDPMGRFAAWFEDARRCHELIEEPNAMAVTSVDQNGQPSTRFVLMRAFNERGFVFYTNYNSRKGQDFAKNPKSCATFFWEPFSRSIRIEGEVEKLSSEESDSYWNGRPREHQLGALSSNQSATLIDDSELTSRYSDLEQKYNGVSIPRPEFWGGYVIKPQKIEFWQGRASRLHERLQYERQNKTGMWQLRRLSP